MFRSWTFLGTLCVLLAAATPEARAGQAPVFTAGYQQARDGGVEGWTLARASGARISGGAGLHVENPAAGAETTVESGPVRLEVGQLYRLSATIRAKGVRSDPVARYPTALGACVSMKSFPFTNASATVAGDREDRVSVAFFATTASDRVQLHLGRNGSAAGEAWFRDVKVEKVDDLGEIIPPGTVRWAGKGFRYDDGGWIVAHVEGAPYERGRQFGLLVSGELNQLLDKLALQADKADPAKGWASQRAQTDALFLRKFDVEFLEEMKGIADGAAEGGAAFRGRPVDLLDVVAMNSAIDLDYMNKAMPVTPNPLTGRGFLKAEDEAARAGQGDHCNSFIATGSATPDGRVVMGQMFMWNGYTGVHWNVILDVQPAKGHRFVMETFPGGISSGTDWYLNDAGIIIGETTVVQTPFNPEGTPEANRIRKAIQYGASIDEVAGILQDGNNGLYTNDWTIADTKTDEGAVLLLGTKRSRLWRTGSKGHPADTPGGLKDFVWADNNDRDLGVREESVANHDDDPVDLAFNTWNRDIAWNAFYREKGAGRIDLEAAIRAQASSPINRPHACDGKVTTAEMAEKLMFLAHFGKTTLREKWVGGRYIPDLPGALPQLSLGYTTFSPVFVADKLKAAHAAKAEAGPAEEIRPERSAQKEALAFPKRLLWKGTAFPASDADNWFTSGSAAYHALLRHAADSAGKPGAQPDLAKAAETLGDGLAELNARYAYLTAREGTLAPRQARTAYDRYGAYQIPRIKGTFLLHQLRLLLGNAAFAKAMDAVQDQYREKPMTTEDFIAALNRSAGRDLRAFVLQWLDRDDLPDPAVSAARAKAGKGWQVTLKVEQKGRPWHFVAFAEIRTAKGSRMERVEAASAAGTFTFRTEDKPLRVRFNAGNDLPVPQDNPYTLPNQLDDFDHLLFVFGTTREVEANRSLALNYRETLADAFTEILPPIKPDAEVTEADLAGSDLVVFGGPDENGLLARMARDGKLPLAFGRNFFAFQGRACGRGDDGLAIALPNPYNPKRALYLFTANSRLELWHMTHAFQRGLPAWVRYRGAAAEAKGYSPVSRFDLPLD